MRSDAEPRETSVEDFVKVRDELAAELRALGFKGKLDPVAVGNLLVNFRARHAEFVAAIRAARADAARERERAEAAEKERDEWKEARDAIVDGIEAYKYMSAKADRERDAARADAARERERAEAAEAYAKRASDALRESDTEVDAAQAQVAMLRERAEPVLEQECDPETCCGERDSDGEYRGACQKCARDTAARIALAAALDDTQASADAWLAARDARIRREVLGKVEFRALGAPPTETKP